MNPNQVRKAQKAQYKMDEQVHPMGKAWMWWQFRRPGDIEWQSCINPPKFDGYCFYQRRESAPKLNLEWDGTVRLLDTNPSDNQGLCLTHDHLRAQYELDEQVHPEGKAWEWWECSRDGHKFIPVLFAPPSWNPEYFYRRKECAPTVYDDHGVTRVMADGTCDGWDKAVSPSTVVMTAEPVRVDDSEWTKTLTDDPEESQLLEDITARSDDDDDETWVPNDLVHHPYHYAGLGEIECIDALEQLAADGHDFRILNAMKYLWRYRHKGGAESLRKAVWYIERVIGDME